MGETLEVEFTVDAYPDDVFAGVVSQVRLEPIVESNVVSYVTTIDVRNPDLKLKPGNGERLQGQPGQNKEKMWTCPGGVHQATGGACGTARFLPSP